MQDCLFTWTESSRYARSRVKDKFNRNDAQAQQRFNYKADRYCQKRLYNRNISGDEQNPVLVTTWPQSEKEIDIGDGKELLRSANGPPHTGNLSCLRLHRVLSLCCAAPVTDSSETKTRRGSLSREPREQLAVVLRLGDECARKISDLKNIQPPKLYAVKTPQKKQPEIR